MNETLKTTTAENVINKAIDNAYKIGDKDECFWKHVEHTLVAIYVGNDIDNLPDYADPGLYDDEGEDLKNFDELMKKQYELWTEVEKVAENVGKDIFRALALKNKHDIKISDFYIGQARDRSYLNK